MKINFVGSFTTGYVGETADEVHLANSMEDLGHKVRRIPRDIWKAFCDGEWDDNWNQFLSGYGNADVAVFAKWNAFGDGKYIEKMKEACPTVYWTWDWMEWPVSHEWHRHMCQAADLHLTNEGDYNSFESMRRMGIKPYYFPFDVTDEFPRQQNPNKIYDVVFFGSYLGQGDRIKWLPIIAKECDLTIFSWNYQDWQKVGLTAKPPVYGNDFNRVVGESKICLQMSVNDHLWGYWSNRVGKVLVAGGFLLARYVPGMELFLRDGADYFSSPEEAVEKIKYHLHNPVDRIEIQKRGAIIGQDRFTSKARVTELMILLERFIKNDGKMV